MSGTDDELICPACGTDDDLAGRREGDVIHITCDACDLSWDRDLRPRCRSCGRDDVRSAAQAIWEKSRGTQMSIVSIRTVYLCPDCDADRFERVRESNTPLPPDDDPAGGMR